MINVATFTGGINDPSSRYRIRQYINKLKKGGVYIHTDATPLGDFDPNFKPFVKNFEDNDIKFNIVKCTGHARPLDLIKIINLTYNTDYHI